VTPPDDLDVEVHTPGDDEFRLLNKISVTTGKSVRLDGEEENDEIVCLTVESRSLASAAEVEKRHFGMHYDAAQWLRNELDRVLAAHHRGESEPE
jgi:hypothetical protein